MPTLPTQVTFSWEASNVTMCDQPTYVYEADSFPLSMDKVFSRWALCYGARLWRTAMAHGGRARRACGRAGVGCQR